MPQVGTNVRVRVSGVDEAIGKIARLNRRIQAALSSVLRTYALMIHAKAVRNAPGDTGKLRSSGGVLIKRTFAKVAFTADYAAFVEFGTGPLGAKTNRRELPDGYEHGTSHGRPPADALEGWANRHNANVYEVTGAIMKRGGNPAQPYLGPAYDSSIEGFRRNLRRVIKTVMGELSIG